MLTSKLDSSAETAVTLNCHASRICLLIFYHDRVLQLYTNKHTFESHGILKYVRRSIGLDEDTEGNSSLEYAYFVIGLFLIDPIARQKTARVTL